MAGKRATKIDAVLRHLAAGGDIQDFPGTKYENLALARTVERRGLVVWDKEGNRYVPTPAGWSALTPRRFGLPSLAVSTAIGAAIGAAALALLWLPSLKWEGSAQATTSPAVERPAIAAASAPVEIGGRSVAPMTAAPVTPASATPAAAADPLVIAAEPPVAETPPVKPATVKKPHRRTARPSEQANPFASPWRGRETSYPRYGQGSWFSYR